MITVKISHTILSAWAAGRWEDAIGMYMGKDLPATPAMELGKLKHLEWEHHIKQTSELPDVLGGGLLIKPQVEQKYRKILPFNKDYQLLLSGKPDATHDGDTVIEEFKVGRTEAIGYINAMQLPYYKLLVPSIELGVYRCWNPYLRKLTVGIRYLDDRDAEEALNHIYTHGGELLEYLAANRMIKDFKEVAHA